MSEVKVNKISPRTACGTVTLGDSGDTFTVPAGVSITNSGTASGFGATGETSWVTTVKTATFTATAGEGYFCNTTAGAFTLNLPAGSAGNSVALQDYANTFDSNALTVTPNGSEKINGGLGSLTLTTEGQGLTLIYIDGTQGWRSVIDSDFAGIGNNYVAGCGGTPSTWGDYKIHKFTGPGTFTVTAAGAPAGSTTIDYLLVAGGAGGGSTAGGGGGGGGFRLISCQPVSVTGYPIVVGSGGVKGCGGAGGTGGVTTFRCNTSAGGGGGAPNSANGVAGGSGGGGGAGNASDPAGGAGNTPATPVSQGNAGGSGDGTPQPQGGGGGGGGAGVIGTNFVSAGKGGPGGNGTDISPTFGPGFGDSSFFAGGGGGGAQSNPAYVAPLGGNGGGGTGGGEAAPYGGGSGVSGGNGTINTGGGGGGNGNANCSPVAGTGGSGIVIIRYKFQN